MNKLRSQPILAILFSTVALGHLLSCTDPDSEIVEPVSPESPDSEDNEATETYPELDELTEDRGKTPSPAEDDSYQVPLDEDPFTGEPITGEQKGTSYPDADPGEKIDREPDASYGAAFEDKPNYDEGKPVEAEDDFQEPSIDGQLGSGDETGSSQQMVTRYVDAILLNVRAQPSLSSPIVRRLLGGARIRVTISGRFARIKEGQYVAARYLSSQPTRKVNRNEVAKWWAKSKYKDTWQPPRP